MLILIQQCSNSGQRLLTICNDSQIGLHILVNLALVNIQMDNLGLLGVCLRISCHTIRKTHANGYQHVALLFFQVDGIVAMHAQHSYIQRMVRGQCTQT